MKSCNTQTRSKHYQHFSNGSVSLCGCTLFLKIFKIYFICIWLCWVFVAVPMLSLVAASKGCSAVVCGLLIPMSSLVEEHRA